MKKLSIVFLLCLVTQVAFTQSDDEKMIKAIFDKALTDGQSYEMLEYLTTKIGARLSGSPQAAAAVEWSRQVMTELNFDHVFLQDVMVPHWVRGKQEIGRVVQSKKGAFDFNVCAIGMSVGTGAKGVYGKVIEVKGFDELEKIGRENIEGNIVFFNRPFDPTIINTFAAYGGAVGQRASGPSEAAKFGAAGVVVRSMGSNLEDYPHTGGLNYRLNIPKIPAIAIATRHAEQLSALLQDDPDLRFYFETHCETLEDKPSHNVVGELKGKKSPNEYIVVGGHLDSWDLGQGAHDDGAGCVQSIEALRILKEIGYTPNRTLRAVMFMNEENGLRGGIKYAELAEKNKEKHLAAMESDRGGFLPIGFTMSGDEKAKKKIQSWKPLFAPYGLYNFEQAGGGADISPLANQNVFLIGLYPDSQRYFDYHHTAEDTFDKVNKRELELGAAAMAALIYLIDKYGL